MTAPMDTAAARRLAAAFTAAPLTGDGADGWGCRRIGWALEEALDALDAARAEVARLREAMPDAGVLESATVLTSSVAPDSRLWHELSAAAARIRALDAGADTTEGADDDH